LYLPTDVMADKPVGKFVQHELFDDEKLISTDLKWSKPPSRAPTKRTLTEPPESPPERMLNILFYSINTKQ